MEELEGLVKKAMNGSIEAYTYIVRQVQDMACAYAYTILDDFHHAQDACQEAFIEAYQQLPTLKEPRAFLSWFRLIVFKQCDRQLRRRKLPVCSLDKHYETKEVVGDPVDVLEEMEIQQNALQAVWQLPQKQREVTTLFYVNGYSYGDISSFLEIPVSTVKKRLHDSRRKLRERMIDMTKKDLKKHQPDASFAEDVIRELLNRPKLLEITGHPIRQAVEIICSELSEYEVVEGSEVIQEKDAVGICCDREHVYRMQGSKYLRSETSMATFSAIQGRTPPIQLLTAGRVFRPDEESALILKVFHHLDAVCVKQNVTLDDMKKVLERSVRSVVGALPIRYRPAKFRHMADSVELEIQVGSQWHSIAGGGMLASDTLVKSGFDPERINGFAFGLGLECLVTIKLGIEDVRQLWQHPYI